MIKKILLLFAFFQFFIVTYAYAGVVGGAIGAAIWSIGVMIVDYAWVHPFITAFTVASIAYSLASGSKADKLGASGSKYTSRSIENTFSNEGIVPIIYGGPILVGGNIIWQSEPGTTVQRFIGFCIGEVSSVSNIIIDEKDIATLSGCSYTAYTGTSTQTVDARGSATVKGLRDVCYVAATITAGDDVSSNPTLGAKITGKKVALWDAGIHQWTASKAFSKNPSAIIRDYMGLSVVLGGCGVSSSFIDDDSFGDFYEHCAEGVSNGSGGTEERYELTIALDTKHSALDNLAKMLITCNAQLIRSGATYKIVYEKSGETSVMAFTEDNIDNDTFNYGYGKSDEIHNKIGVEWISPLEIKNPKRIAWAEDELDQDIRGIRESKIEMYGIIRQSQASRQANKILYEGKLNDIWCEFESTIEAMHCEQYDIVSVTHSRPNWDTALFRIMSITEANFGRAKYVCNAYNSSVLDDGFGSTFDDWDSGNPPNPYEAVVDVTNIALSETGWVNVDGTWVVVVDVSWTAPATNRDLLNNYIIELAKSGGSYTQYGIADKSATTFRISSGLNSGQTYNIKVKTQSVKNIISTGRISNPITLVGKSTNPSNVSSFTSSWGKNLELSWAIVTDSDLSGYEIRDEDANFGTDDAHLIYRGLANKKVLIPSSRAPGTYWLRSINSSGKYSITSAQITPVNAAPAIPLSLTADIVFNIARLCWTDDTATDIEYYDVYYSKTNAWAGEEKLFGKVPGRNCTIQGESSQNGMSDANGAANTDYVTDLDLAGWGPDYWRGSYIEIISGTGVGEELKVSAYATATGKFTMDDNWVAPPDTTSKFFLHPVRYYKVRGVDGFGAGNFTSAVEVKYIEFTEGMLGDQIITARKVYAGEVITLSAQIKDAIIQNAHIIDLSADKITAGSLTITVNVGSAGKIVLDGANDVIKVYDASSILRVELGKLS